MHVGFMKLSFVQRSCMRSISLSSTFVSRLSQQPHELKPSDMGSFNVTSDQKTKLSSLLFDYGFNHGQISRILNSKHHVWELDEKDLSENLVNWYTFEVNHKLFTVLAAYPELLTLNPEHVKARVVELMSLFTRKDIRKLLVTCPSVFLEDLDMIKDKVQYLVHGMGVEQNSVVKYQALKYDLEHIKCRHLFLKLTGLYKVYKKTKSKNCPINKVLTTNVDNFLKLSGLTQEEYDAFCDCFRERDEFENLEDYDLIDDSDEEI